MSVRFQQRSRCFHLKLLYDVDEVVRNAIMSKSVPELVSSYTIKGLLEIDETDVQGCLPLSTLFQDISKDEGLFSCPSSSSVGSLFLP